jgi:hypothetical protein
VAKTVGSSPTGVVFACLCLFYLEISSWKGRALVVGGVVEVWVVVGGPEPRRAPNHRTVTNEQQFDKATCND